MSNGTLPLHPTARHPRTGAPLRALYVTAAGRVMWPIIGASPDDGAGGDDAAAKAAADAAAAKAAADAATAKAAADAAGGAGGSDLGFPPNTPVAEMTLEQQVAYHKHQFRKHEDRNKKWMEVLGGKTPEEVQADLVAAEKLRQDSMTDAQRQIEEAKKTSRTESAMDGARVALEFALGHDPEKNDVSSVIDALDMSKLLTDDGRVDTAKVRSLAATIAPSDKGQGKQHDFGGGSRGGQSGTGVAAGRSRYQERHGKPADKANA